MTDASARLPLEVLDGAISDIERVVDGKMWRNLNGELTWRGETPDGNEIEAEPPRVLLASALSALRALRAGIPEEAPKCGCGSTFDPETGVCNRTGILANHCDGASLSPSQGALPPQGSAPEVSSKEADAIYQDEAVAKAFTEWEAQNESTVDATWEPFIWATRNLIQQILRAARGLRPQGSEPPEREHDNGGYTCPACGQQALYPAQCGYCHETFPALTFVRPQGEAPPSASEIANLRAAIPQWHEVDQGGEVFGWRVPRGGIATVIPAPREVEDFTRDALGGGETLPTAAFLAMRLREMAHADKTVAAAHNLPDVRSADLLSAAELLSGLRGGEAPQ